MYKESVAPRMKTFSDLKLSERKVLYTKMERMGKEFGRFDDRNSKISPFAEDRITSAYFKALKRLKIKADDADSNPWDYFISNYCEAADLDFYTEVCL